MKATFVYSNGKTFTANNVIEQTLDIKRVKRKGLADLVTVDYSVIRTISGDTLGERLASLLERESATANGITSTLHSPEDMPLTLEVVEEISIPATENGLVYILVQGQDSDIDSNGVLTPDIFGNYENDENIKPVIIIPVLDKKIDRLVVADCLSLML